MRARDAAEQLALEVGGAVVRLRDCGFTWTQIGHGLDLKLYTAKELAVLYLLHNAETGGQPLAVAHHHHWLNFVDRDRRPPRFSPFLFVDADGDLIDADFPCHQQRRGFHQHVCVRCLGQ